MIYLGHGSLCMIYLSEMHRMARELAAQIEPRVTLPYILGG